MFAFGFQLKCAVVFALVPAMLHAGNEVAESLTIERDLVFATVDGHELTLDLYVPSAQLPAPLVIWIHGGGWRAGSKAKVPIQDITNQGYALASISYRFTDKAIFPAQIHNCKAAVRWLRSHAKKFGYNADWTAVGGSSAGGHLALLLGVASDVGELEGTVGDELAQSSAVQAVLNFYGPSDFVLRGRTQPKRAYTERSGSLRYLEVFETERSNPSWSNWRARLIT
jgi:acetyl esterase/lipase